MLADMIEINKIEHKVNLILSFLKNYPLPTSLKYQLILQKVKLYKS